MSKRKAGDEERRLTQIAADNQETEKKEEMIVTGQDVANA